jgi:hypothetical protein
MTGRPPVRQRQIAALALYNMSILDSPARLASELKIGYGSAKRALHDYRKRIGTKGTKLLCPECFGKVVGDREGHICSECGQVFPAGGESLLHPTLGREQLGSAPVKGITVMNDELLMDGYGRDHKYRVKRLMDGMADKLGGISGAEVERAMKMYTKVSAEFHVKDMISMAAACLYLATRRPVYSFTQFAPGIRRSIFDARKVLSSHDVAAPQAPGVIVRRLAAELHVSAADTERCEREAAKICVVLQGRRPTVIAALAMEMLRRDGFLGSLRQKDIARAAGITALSLQRAYLSAHPITS